MSADSLAAALKQADDFERQKQYSAAIAIYRRILAARPNDANVWNLLGVALFHAGDPAAAIAAYERAIELDPRRPEPHYNLGNALRLTGDFPRAIAELRTAAELRPGDARLQHKLGCVLLERGEAAAAGEAFQTTLRLQPEHVEALANLGACLLRLGRLDEATRCFERATSLNPRSVTAWNNWGALHLHLKHWSAAERCFREAVALAPQQAEAHNNLGAAYEGRLDLAAAEACYRRALEVRPNYPTAHYNLGNVLLATSRLDEAEQSYDRAIELRPNYAEAIFQRGTLRMLRGDLPGGYAGFARRWELPTAVKLKRTFSAPVWDGGELGGKTLLLYAEQGYGDLFQFIRFARQARERGGRIVLECRPEIIPALQPAHLIDEFITPGYPPPPLDCCAALMDLPAILRMTAETIPAQTPYLGADPYRIEHWRQALAGPRGLKVGIVWQGSPTYLRDASRSIPLREFLPLAQVPNVRLLSLQRGAGSEQLRDLPPDLRIETLPDDVDRDGAFLDTAAIMMNLDLVITSDTSAAHLAGALGRPAWTVLGAVPDWRWFLDREDSPWYPTMRLFRRKSQGDWADVFAVLVQELRNSSEV